MVEKIKELNLLRSWSYSTLITAPLIIVVILFQRR